MSFSMKKSVALIGAAAMLVSVAACGSDTASSNGGSGSDGGKTTITVWGWDSTLKDVAKKFM